MTIPIAICVGLWERMTGSMKGASYVGIAAIMVCVFVGPYIEGTWLGEWLMLKADTVSIILPMYAFFATALPVWMLLTPRGYLSSFMKIGVFGALIVGVVFINPEIHPCGYAVYSRRWPSSCGTGLAVYLYYYCLWCYLWVPCLYRFGYDTETDR